MTGILLMRAVFAMNVLVAGWIGVTSMISPGLSARTVFSGVYASHEVIRLVGCLWMAIAVISLLGLLWPITFSPILLLQLIYKTAWLIVVAVPAIVGERPYPVAMALFFAAWVLVLPFVIPWRSW